ncbi:hypothetical protein ABZY16_06795 [Streptomyces sp. NPDC006553]|uniref:hypothetical protein n=1 Tax=Streptomyces sp. NPDC006553 TaxID=3157180 RepID=UPI0033B4A64F
MDPDPGLRLLVQFLSTYDVPVAHARRTRYREPADRFGYSLDRVDGHLSVGLQGLASAWIQGQFRPIYVR